MQGAVRDSLTHVLDDVTRGLSRTEAVLLAAADPVAGMHVLTAPRPGANASRHNTTAALMPAPDAPDCAAAVTRGRDDRGVAVTLGSVCLRSLGLSLAVQVDDAQIEEDGVELAVRYVDSQNRLRHDTTVLPHSPGPPYIYQPFFCQGQPPGTTSHQRPTAANCHHQPPTANRQPSTFEVERVPCR